MRTPLKTVSYVTVDKEVIALASLSDEERIKVMSRVQELVIRREVARLNLGDVEIVEHKE
ncbi:MAG: hypothetical protein FWC80_00875 [Firmicutes bacterium]|nr:hypothetical protein [Bacillota bacterium]